MPKVSRLYISINDAAETAGVSSKTVRRRIACGDLPAFRTGRLIRVKLGDVENAMMRPIPVGGDGEPPGGTVAPNIRREHESRGSGSAAPEAALSALGGATA